MIRRPPRSTRTDTLFPYTTLFRSALVVAVLLVIIHPDAGLDRQLIGELPAQLAEQRRAGVLEKLRVDRGQSAQHRSEEHTSELQSLMRISYAVFCLQKKKTTQTQTCLSLIKK